MSSRGQIAARQRDITYRPSGEKARHISLETFVDTRVHQQVKGRIAEETFCKGDLVVTIGSKFYLAASKWEGYFYVVVNQDGVWKCSSSDDRVKVACIALVQLHVQKKSNLLLSGAYE
jgi:hypothetical protein